MPIRNPTTPSPTQPNVQPRSPARTSPATGAAQQVEVKAPEEPAQGVRDEVAKKAAEKLIGVLETHKDVSGNAEASAGKGDPRITERRSAMSTLIAAKAAAAGGVDLDALALLSPGIKDDIAWLKAAERQEYPTENLPEATYRWGQPADPNNPFSWSKSDMARPHDLLKEFKTRIGKGQEQAKGIESGSQRFLDVADGSLVGLSFVKSPEKRAAGLADALLQFRGRKDLANQEEGGYSNQKRIDKIGPALVAEQRVLLATAQIGADDPAKLREYALLKQVIASHPLSSANGIFDARNAVGAIFHTENNNNYSSKTHPTAWVMNETPPGATASPYKAIHHNYSRDTPHNIKCSIDEWMFPVGPKEKRSETYTTLTDALGTARGGDVAAGKALLAIALKQNPEGAKDLAAKMEGVADDKWADSLRDALAGTCTQNLGEKSESQEKNLLMFSRLYRAVCETRPTDRTLEQNLFKAGAAWPEVADVLVRMREGNSVGTLRELGEARAAMRDAILGSDKGFERHELILFDAQLERLTTEELGAAVERVGDLATDPEKAEALIAVQTALRSAVASGLHAIKDESDPAASKGEALDAVLADVDGALKDGKVDEDEYRGLMSRVYVSVARTVQNIRSFVDGRAADVASGKVEVDPMFLDQLVKQTPLHYATALAEKGMRAGLVEKIGARHIENPAGMRVLNSIGPVAFGSVVFAQNSKELVEKKPAKDALSILWELQEKKMVAVGGLIVDEANAPGGNSHLNMYAMNNGIAVLALPDLREKYAAFLERAAEEGGLYVDDRNGEFHMMTVDYAIEKGHVKEADLDSLRPGMNRKITYLKSNANSDGFDVLGSHEAMISPERKTREVELYVPMDEVRGVGKEVTSFEDIAALGVHGRHLAGEKGLVLALMMASPELGEYIPDGSIVTTGVVNRLLREADIYDDWQKPWTHDPKVGRVDDDNFLKSAFFTDPDYRAKTRENLQAITKDKLTEHYIGQGDDGSPTLTDAGKKFYDELMGNPALKDSLIFRSSYTGEDRPGKSGAGQYESYVDLKLAKKMYGAPKVDESLAKIAKAEEAVRMAEASDDAMALDEAKTALEQARSEHRELMGPPRMEATIGVIESCWMAEPVENNVADEVNLMHIAPSVTVQNCLDPQISGVMISRDIEHGTRGQVSYQLVKGFGGGVDGGKTEEGLLSASGHTVNISYPGEENGLADAKALAELREIVLNVEKFFHETVEPGKGYAVDLEVARENDQWKVVQARVILMDK